jgi:4-alpha-glucanotransferase
MPKMLGTLLPLSAIGSFTEGEKFINWLVNTHQQAWQLLPLHPTGWKQSHLFASPYAGYGVGLNPLFAAVPKALPSDPGFAKEHQGWLADFCLFMALADHFKTDHWSTWPAPIRNHRPDAVKQWTIKLAPQIQYHQNLQAFLYRQYALLRQAANSKGIALIGDVPFYLSLNSPLVWTQQKAFLIDDDGQLPYVSGVTASTYFPRQIWDLPLYRYQSLEKVIDLWKMRLRYAATLYDRVRLDSAISFYVYNQIHPHDPHSDTTLAGPGDKVVRPLLDLCQRIGLDIFVENISAYDLGPLQTTLDKYQVPGVAVYALSPEQFELHALNPQTIYYSSTHDTVTLREYSGSLKKARETRDYFINNCQNLILPLQDWQLTSQRINSPGTPESKNWHYIVDLLSLPFTRENSK